MYMSVLPNNFKLSYWKTWLQQNFFQLDGSQFWELKLEIKTKFIKHFSYRIGWEKLILQIEIATIQSIL